LNGKAGTPEFAAWDVVGAAVLEELGKAAPKSFDVEVTPARPATGSSPARPARIAGTDADIIRAADDAGIPPTDLVFVDPEVVLDRQPRLLEAILGSERLLDGLNDPTARPLFSPAEAQALLDRVQAGRPTIDASFFRELAGTRFVERLRTAVDAMKDLAQAKGERVTSVSVEQLDPGTNKVAVRVSLTLAKGQLIEFVVAKGDISITEANNYRDYGPLQITQRLLAPLMEGADGGQALLITEFWPGRKVTPGVVGFYELLDATAEPAYAGALGALFARIWFGTMDRATGIGKYDADLHHRNINVRDGGALDAARAVDFNKSTPVTEGPAWVAELLRRVQTQEPSTGVKNMDAFLDGALEQMTLDKTVGRAEGLRLLNRVSLDLLDPDVVAAARRIQDFIDDPAIVTRASSILDAWLARQSQGGFLGPAPGARPVAWLAPAAASVAASPRAKPWSVLLAA
jgi:hypothetical protein